jgi:DNA-binding response OmpR family regulator
MARILVVDDDRSIVEMLQFLLAKDKHTVFVAQDGKTGLETAKRERPDLIILDVMMPEMDGLSVSATLFKDPAMIHTPILILTARGRARGIAELVPNVGFYMDKPFEPEELLQNVRMLLKPR